MNKVLQIVSALAMTVLLLLASGLLEVKNDPVPHTELISDSKKISAGVTTASPLPGFVTNRVKPYSAIITVVPAKAKEVRVTVLRVSTTDVILVVNDKAWKIRGDKLLAWNSNMLLQFGQNGPKLRKSQISVEHYNRAVVRSAPAGNLI